MKWTVVWNSHAEDALIQRWLEADSEMRAKILAAVDNIDRILGESADTVGESRETELRRMLFVEPLAVTFEVRPLDCIANVLSSHLWTGRR